MRFQKCDTDRQCLPNVLADAVGRPGCFFRALRPYLVYERLPDVSVLRSHRTAQVHFDFVPFDFVEGQRKLAGLLLEASDPFAGIQDLGTDSHPHARDFLAGYGRAERLNRNQHLCVWQDTELADDPAVDMDVGAFRVPRVYG